jgi:putative hemolysin
METGEFRLFSFRKRNNRKIDAERESDLVIPIHRKLGSSMTHRSDIVWIDASSKKNGIIEIIKSHPEFANFPVCAGTVDSVLGVLSARSFLESLLESQWCGLKALVKKPVYLPETVTIAETLSALEENECRMAFIIDEYGGIEGLVTRNGLMSELLGEVSGEGAENDPDIFRRDDGSYLVGGQARMDEIREIFALPDVESGSHEYYTLAGYLLSVNGSIPKTGDKIIAGNYTCEIMDMDGHRIDKVLISSRPAAEAE